MELLRIAAGLAALVAPGLLVVSRLFPGRPLVERWVVGATLGVGGAILLAFSLGQWRLDAFFPAWGAVAVGAGAAWWRMPARPSLLGRPSGAVVGLFVVLALHGIFLFGAIAPHIVPLRYDPSFHLLLARKIVLANGMIHDWLPFEDIALNYTIGSHVLVALQSVLTGLELHRVFLHLMPACGLIAIGQIFVLGRRVFARDDAALLGAAVYGLWARMGAMDYFRWGGLPNQVGMILFVGALVLALEATLDRRHVVLLAVLLASLVFTHHHVTLTGGAILACVGVAHAVADRSLARAGRLLGAAALAALLASFYLVPYATKAAAIGGTKALAHKEAMMGFLQVRVGVGPLAFWVGLAGLVLLLLRPRDAVPGRAALWIGTIVCAVGFAFFGYVVRAYYFVTLGEDRIALAPSRFLTDLVYFLALAAGYALAVVRSWLRLPVALVLLVVVAGAWTNRNPYVQMRKPVLEPRYWEAYAWVREHTPEDTIVVNDGEQRFAAYGTWRRCTGLPMPRTEPLPESPSPTVDAARIRRGDVPAGLDASLVVGIVEPDRPLANEGHPVLWRHAPSGLAVVEIWRR